ncbi:MAG: hypothetical protein U0640_12965 [Phycisphaerales bacterium]
MKNRACALLLSVGACMIALTVGGCATSNVWERSLERGPDQSPLAGSKDTSVKVRQVSWDRIEGALLKLESEASASDVHPDEWSADRKLAAKGTLLKGLQVSQPASNVSILGRSQFRTSSEMRNQEPVLEAVARKLGANMVVYSTRYLGKTEKVVDHPVSSQSWRSGYRRDRDGDYHPDTWSETTTTWIPIRMSVDETGGIAYYLYVME